MAQLVKAALISNIYGCWMFVSTLNHILVVKSTLRQKETQDNLTSIWEAVYRCYAEAVSGKL